jgi:hypothetical protein
MTTGDGELLEKVFLFLKKNNKTTWDQKPLAYIIAITTYVNLKNNLSSSPVGFSKQEV